jgi:intracellular multiplication protein IcmL
MSSTFYRNSYRKALGAAVLLSTSASVLAAILVMMSWREPQPTYFATTTNGVVTPLYSLSEPVLTSQFILEWASLAARKAFNLDFVHYADQLNEAKPYFTSDGWEKFQGALKSSGMLDTVTDKKVVMSAIVSGTPVVLSRAVVHGRFTWTIQLPVLVSFSSTSEKRKMQMIITMNVQRVPTLDASQGVQISDFAAQDMNP